MLIMFLGPLDKFRDIELLLSATVLEMSDDALEVKQSFALPSMPIAEEDDGETYQYISTSSYGHKQVRLNSAIINADIHRFEC